jgi:uncharacterized RDD family membrane protein YckC
VEELEKAGFLMRLMAWLIDSAAITILSFVIVLLFSGVVTIGERSGSGFIDFFAGVTAFLLAGVNLILQFLYFGFLWSRDGQSFGMKAANIRVVRQDGFTFPSFFRAGLRGSVGYWISGLIFGLGYFWALFDSDSETWHDKIFDTWVVVPSPFEVKSK